jgi:hypothetical protein
MSSETLGVCVHVEETADVMILGDNHVWWSAQHWQEEMSARD